MATTPTRQKVEKHIPSMGNANQKSPIAYQMTRVMVSAINAVQMALIEAYMNGLEVPDPALKALLNTYVLTVYQYFPSLLIPYAWLSKESDRLAKGAQKLMKIQYDLPCALFNTNAM